MSTPEILAAYRRLYKSFLRAVQYRVPERYVGRDQLRASFRDMPATAPAYTAANGLGAGVYDAVGIKRTYWLFQAAAKERGLEAQIVKNLLRVQLRAATKKPTWRRRWLDEKQKEEFDVRGERAAARKHYEMTVAMLNQSMGTRLR